MKIENIAEGEVFGNYKELCFALDEKQKSGKSKTLQLVDWKRYFDFQKEGQKFLITEIYDEPRSKAEDKRIKGNNAIYVQYIELILLNKLAHAENFTCTLTKNKLFLLLGMTNSRYKEKPYKELMESNSSIKMLDINQFYQRTNQKLDRILFDALKNLKSRCLLSYFEEIVIAEEICDNTNNQKSEEHRIASEKEIECIDDIKKQVLDEMNLVSLTQVFLKFKGDKFYKRIDEIIYEKYGWLYTYIQYRLVYARQNIVKDIPRAELQLSKLQLNNKVVSAVNLQAKNKYNQNRKEIECKTETFLANWDGWGEPSFNDRDIGIFVLKNNYIEIQEELSEYLLKINDNLAL